MHASYLGALSVLCGLIFAGSHPLLADHAKPVAVDGERFLASFGLSVETLSPAELGVVVAAPVTVPPNAEWDVTCTVTNRGTTALNSIGLQISRIPGLEVLSVGTGTLDASCCSDFVVNGVADELPPGGSVSVTVHLRAAGAGVWPVSVRAFNQLNDPGESGDEKFIYSAPAGGIATAPNFAVPFPHVEWSSARFEWIAWSGRSVVFLAPFNLTPHGALRFPEVDSGFTATDDGKHAWAILRNGDVGRLTFASGIVDLRFPVPLALVGGHGAIVAPPYVPNELMAAGLDSDGHPTAISYTNGVARSLTYTNGLVPLDAPFRVAASINRYYLALGTQLRELQVTGLGLEETQNLDSFGRAGDSLALSSGLLFHAPDAAIEVSTLQVFPTGPLANNFVFGIGYGQEPAGDGNIQIRSYDAVRRDVIWRKILTTSNITELVSGGFFGALIRGTNGGIVQTPPNPGVDLQLTAVVASSTVPVGELITIPVSITKLGAWSGLNTRLAVDQSKGISAVDPASPSDHWILPIGNIDAGVNLSLAFRINESGPQAVTLRLESDFSDPNLTNNYVYLSWNNTSTNQVLLEDVFVGDNGEPLTLRLTSPAEADLDLRFHLDLLNASRSDVLGTNFVVHFAQGESSAQVPIVAADSRVEGPEDFRIVWDPGTVPPTKPFALVTITNDDRVELITGNVTVLEGNSGTHLVQIPMILSAATDTELRINYATTGRSATAAVDFESTFGTLVYFAGQRTNVVEVRIIGDTAWESDETFEITLSLPPDISPLASMPVVTIQNDDQVHLLVANLSIPEGNEGTNTIQVPVILDAPAAGRLEINYTLVERTASVGLDFVGATGNLVFEPGQQTNFIPVGIIGDRVVEGNEQFSISLVAPAGVVLPTTMPVVTIMNDDKVIVVPPAVLRVRITAAGTPVFEFDSISGLGYTVESRTNLSSGDWVVEGPLRPGTGLPLVIEPKSLAREGYWRVRVQVQ